jgi:HD-GYP domain-containing protein (c-di-GMP phosphodiesterase class II)
MQARQHTSDDRPREVPLATVSRACATQLRQAARHPASVYLPHPDGGFVLWAGDSEKAATPPLEMRLWWDGLDEGWRLCEDGYHFMIPLVDGDELVGLARLGPCRERQLGFMRSMAVDRCLPDVISDLVRARHKEAALASDERVAIEKAVDELFERWKGNLPALLCEAISLDVLADSVTLDPNDEVVIVGSRRASPIPVAIMEHQLARSKEQEGTEAYRTLCALADAMDARAPHTFGHSHRVTAIADALIRRFTNDEGMWRTVGMAARLHDVGASFCGTQALKKVRLDDAERAVVQRHPEIGYRIARILGIEEEVAEGIRSHHERWDGQGYPDGKSGAGIPLVGQVIAVAEVFDALTSPRPWREAISLEAALATIREGAGTQFNAIVVETFLAMHEPEAP